MVAYTYSDEMLLRADRIEEWESADWALYYLELISTLASVSPRKLSPKVMEFLLHASVSDSEILQQRSMQMLSRLLKNEYFATKYAHRVPVNQILQSLETAQSTATLTCTQELLNTMLERSNNLISTFFKSFVRGPC